MNHNANQCNKIDVTLDSTNRKTCPLGVYNCRHEQISENCLHQHYVSEQHQNSLVRYTEQIIEETNSGPSRADTDMKEEPSPFQETYEKLSITAQHVEANQNDLHRHAVDLLPCSNKISSIAQELNDFQETHTLENAQIDAISLNQNVLRQEMTTMKDQLKTDNDKATQEPDGMMVWKVTNLGEKIRDAVSERQTSIYSKPFYTSQCGYVLCNRLYLNGDGSARGSHISLFLVVLRGQHDSLLKWPFPYRVSFCLCDQRTIIETNVTMQPKHIIESFRPDINSISFQRPCSMLNIASGIPKFFPLSEFNRPENENRYVLNDTIYIRTFIDFVGVSRSMLPFIFNVNIALPMHIQQKLIADEMARCEQQTTN